jgi:bifunctional DNA-binding transcriptional regulator/antitoxin component of YhaV-PrlF toxin-antitoxin module
MKLQKQRSYEYGGKEHYKYVVTLPKKPIEKIGWKAGDELEAEAMGNQIVIKKVEGGEMKEAKKMPYEEFKKKIEKILKEEPEGLTWTEIKKRANFQQKVPNNMWVKMMENDIGLVREKKERVIIWRLKR